MGRESSPTNYGWGWSIGHSRVVADVIVFIVEKVVTVPPLNQLVARIASKGSGATAYVVAAANESLRRPIPDWMRKENNGHWFRRMLRLVAAEAYRRRDFVTSKKLSLEAATDEQFVPFSSEYLLFTGTLAFEQSEFKEALIFFDEALQLWMSSGLARVLEPKVGWIANSLKWACLNKLGRAQEGLAFLKAAAEVSDWTCLDRCERWLQLLREAYLQDDKFYLEVALQSANKHCLWWNTELREWRALLS